MFSLVVFCLLIIQSFACLHILYLFPYLLAYFTLLIYSLTYLPTHLPTYIPTCLIVCWLVGLSAVCLFFSFLCFYFYLYIFYLFIIWPTNVFNSPMTFIHVTPTKRI